MYIVVGKNVAEYCIHSFVIKPFLITMSENWLILFQML